MGIYSWKGKRAEASHVILSQWLVSKSRDFNFQPEIFDFWKAYKV